MRFILLTVLLCLFSPFSMAGWDDEVVLPPKPDVYSCTNGRLKINALQTDLQNATACVGGGAGVIFVCTGGDRLVATFMPQAENCSSTSGKMAVSETFTKTTLTSKNIEGELSNLFSINSLTCNGRSCSISLSGDNISSTIASQFDGFVTMVEDTGGDGVSLLTFRLQNNNKYSDK